ncbi:solute carrier family 7 member 14-like [Symsagittifera roscoffensis]|uniref:solute carrier family 7 member 14-like n=1 Tax=Symsagittifera roscoffensis TaxID=84072 RepID=UPI00307B88AC
MISALGSRLFRRKTLEADVMKTELNRCLKTSDLVLIGIGSMVGSGMYVLTGEITHTTTGPAIVLSFLVAGLVSGLSAWCYAEFGSQVPKAGSAYVYTYLTIGEFAAFVIGWNLILEHVIGAAAIVRGLMGYINEISNEWFENSLPETFQDQKFDPYTSVIVLVICCLVCLGVKESVLANNFLTLINISVAFFVIFGGIYFFNWSNFSSPDGFFPFGVGSILDGAAQAYFAFVGYDSIAIASEEALTPSFSIPFALAFDVLFVGSLYCAVSFSLILLVPYDKVDEDAAFASAFKYNGWQWAAYVVSIGAIAAMTCAMLGTVFTMPRCIYAMANDGLIFRSLAKVSPKTQTPIIATILGSLGIAVFAFFLTLNELAEFMSIGTLLAYIIIALAVIVLRYSPNSLLKHSDLDLSINEGPRLGKAQINSLSLFVVMVMATNLFIACASWVSDEYLWPMVAVISISSIITFVILIYLDAISTENPNLNEFRVPFVPYLPGLSVFINFQLMTRLNYFTWIRFALWMLVGFVVYFLYGMRNSSLCREKVENNQKVYGSTDETKHLHEESSITSE